MHKYNQPGRTARQKVGSRPEGARQRPIKKQNKSRNAPFHRQAAWKKCWKFGNGACPHSGSGCCRGVLLFDVFLGGTVGSISTCIAFNPQNLARGTLKTSDFSIGIFRRSRGIVGKSFSVDFPSIDGETSEAQRKNVGKCGSFQGMQESCDPRRENVGESGKTSEEFWSRMVTTENDRKRRENVGRTSENIGRILHPDGIRRAAAKILVSGTCPQENQAKSGGFV